MRPLVATILAGGGRNRIGLIGISWGGYLTCIVAVIDERFKVAVPVYGCGFLGDNSHWTDNSLDAMNPDARQLWLHTFDPSEYVDAFVDSALRGGPPLPKLNATKVQNGVATASIHSPTAIKKAELLYTVDGGAWQKRKWQPPPATIAGAVIPSPLPEQHPLTFYLCVTDARGLRTSTGIEKLPVARP